MADPRHSSRLLRFGTFELNLASHELRKSGALVKLQAQHAQLLALLAQRASEVVTREEIRQSLWDGDTFVDFDRAINVGVNQVRAALDDDPQSPRYIETVPRKGYRFIAPVTEPAFENVTEDKSQSSENTSNRFRHVRLLWFTGVLAAAALAITSNASGWRDRLFKQSATTAIRSLAVLPLENLSHDPEQEYFADGMTDELITALAKISALRVVSRTSVMQYRRTKKPLPQIAQELNVDAVLEGTVLRAQNRVRITAQLIRAAPEEHLWAEKYEGNLEEVLALQDTVAQAVANSIKVKLTPRERTVLATRRAVNAEAYETYLKGRYFLNTLEAGIPEERFPKSRGYFQQAIEQDPGYAPAWAGLAECDGRLAQFGLVPRAEAYTRAMAAAEKALQLDDRLSEAVTRLARVKTEFEWDWAGAERLYQRAIELDPNSGTAHQGYAVHLAAVGRPLAALAEAQRAHEVEPLSVNWDANVAWFRYVAHQYEQAERESISVVELDPNFYWGHINLGSVYLQTGRPQQAVAELRQAAALSNREPMSLMYLGHALGVSGDRAGAQKVLDEMKDHSSKEYFPPELIAVVYEGMGDKDRAFQWYDKAVAERSMHSWVYPDPRNDPIRSDPRFKRLMERMGLRQ
jgi:TolB-like protein/DNA-binding winged helix-turn-helix (wHTH) protein/Tfp pilus assembly protein PilF